MQSLRKVVSYWRDCVKAESALEQSFGIEAHSFTLHERSKARLFIGSHDPFIFAPVQGEYVLTKGKTYDHILRASLKGQDIYFGYPLLMFFDRGTGQNHVAPLFTIRLDVMARDKEVVLTRAEPTPTLGSCAFSKLGLNPEEIVALNNEVTNIFDGNKSSKLEVILYLLKKQTKLTFVEGIDPENLSNASKVHPYDGTVVYNKAVLSIGDASVFNIHLLNDLEKLAKREDLETTALSYIAPDEKAAALKEDLQTPVMPFMFDEYHLQAIRKIMRSRHTVVTGPPGTGKSQFIANLIINLFLQKKRVLFVSHTSEAVKVVNERINKEFVNLIMQTGKKELRQDLGRRLEEMVGRYNDRKTTETNAPAYEALAHNWKTIDRNVAYLRQSNVLYKALEMSSIQQLAVSGPSITLVHRVHLYLLLAKIHWTTWRLSARRPNYAVIADIEASKARHVAMSKTYVQDTYLSLILDNGLYGDLVAYIDAVQSKKFSSPHADKSDRYIHAALKAMNIWSCTLKSLGASFPLKANLFDYVIFDEASQIDLPSAAPALYRAKYSVIVGDENQLNHIAKINTKVEEGLAKAHGLPGNNFYPGLVRYTDTSLFLSAKKALHEPELELKNHYRSNVQIANLFSSIFYGGKLRIFEPAADLPKDMKTGVYWLNAKGSSYKHKAGSRYNSYEATYIVKLLQKILPMAREKGLTIGITTPYSKQQSVIADKVAAAFEQDALERVQILTVHKFQGSEVDILILSPVLAMKGDGGSDYWYLHNKQLLNVAISRARHLLLIVGDQEFALKSESKLRNIAEYCLQLEAQTERAVPNRPMNIFEKQLFDILKQVVMKSYRLEPQYVIGGRFTVDFALLSTQRKIAIELDGAQHEIVGGLPVFEDKQRDSFLVNEGWLVVRIPVYELRQPAGIIEKVNQAQLGRPIG